MKNIKIIANAIVNVSGHGEKFQGDIIRGVSDELAEHLADEIRVAEYLPDTEQAADTAKPAGKSRKKH